MITCAPRRRLVRQRLVQPGTRQQFILLAVSIRRPIYVSQVEATYAGLRWKTVKKNGYLSPIL